MRVLIIGYGVQGHKRQRIAGADAVGVVDPVAAEADWRDLGDVPLDRFDAALVCTPDEPKIEILSRLLANGKHALVEKPLYAKSDSALVALEKTAIKSRAVCYTAYNHRFEPHYVRMRDLLRGGSLGRVYRCRMFYGNGTARLVRDSTWRDQGAGVMLDLGSHLLDTARFWFGDITDSFRVVSANCFENRAPDHVVIGTTTGEPKFDLEMTLLSWRNHFACDVFAEKGSAHITSLCKWGPTTFTVRKRVLPSGRPPETSVTLVQEDPTWVAEYDHFKRLVDTRQRTDLTNDRWLLRVLDDLSARSMTMARGQ